MFAPMTSRARRLGGALFLTLSAIAFYLYKPANAADEQMVFAVAVQSDEGNVLASPVVMGEVGQRVQVRMMCEKDPEQERMRLTLSPVGAEDGQMLYSYELSVAGRLVSERGTVKLSPGNERKIRLRPGDPQGVTLSLYAAPLKHPGLERYLKVRKALLARAAT